MKRRKRILIRIIAYGFIGILLAAGYTLCNYLIVNQVAEKEYAQVYIGQIDGLPAKDVALVPGTAVSEGIPTPKCKDRLDAALSLYEAQLVESVLVSGTAEEVKVMSRYLVHHGIPAEDIKADMQCFDTYNALARAHIIYEEAEFYICTQELYAPRTSYLMKQTGLSGAIVCSDTMFYLGEAKQKLREYFAATKATLDGLFRNGNPTYSVEEEDFWTVLQELEDDSHISPEELELPKDYKLEDVNPSDGYDVLKAVAYAEQYALAHNEAYPLFEQNCTNFVSQCLVAGGISMQGIVNVSDSERLLLSGDGKKWFSISEHNKEEGRWYYSTSATFVNTEAFLDYFTETCGYPLSKYENTYDGKLQCYKELAAGDVMILYDQGGAVAHIGLVTGLGDYNAYFCANTNAQLHYSVFNVNDNVYPAYGVIHMSDK